MNTPLLEVRDLEVRFHLSQRTIHAVNGVSFTVDPGQVIGIVGESGCGKSVTSLAIQEPGRISGGEVLLHDASRTTSGTVDLLKLSQNEMEDVRGNRISMIFQDPMTSLNPVLTIGYQLMEPLRLHRGMSASEAADEAVKLPPILGGYAPARHDRDGGRLFARLADCGRTDHVPGCHDSGSDP